MPADPVDIDIKQHIEKLEKEILDLRRQEVRLKSSEERFRSIFNSMKEIYFEVDLKGNLVHFNPAVCAAYGYTAEELAGLNNRQYATPEAARRMYHIFNELYLTGKPVDINDYEVLAKDGKRHFMEVSAYLIRDTEGNPIGFRGIGRDVTEKIKVEETLKRGRIRYRELFKEAHRAEELYQSLLTSSPDAIILLDVNFHVQFVNPAFTHIFGWSPEEMGNDKIPYIPKPLKEPFAVLIQKVFDQDHPIRGYETQRYTKDGRLLDVSISASRFLDHAGDPAGVLLILRDISEVKRYQWHMQQAQKMESLGTLAGGIAHDFNNLLMGIQGRLSLLMLHKDPKDADCKHLKEIEEYIVRASDLTRQMLGIARSGKFEVKPTNLNDLIKKQNILFGRTKKEITIHEALDAALSSVEVDQRQIEQVLLNMYVNASHAMPGGGDLYIRTANETLDKSRTAPYDLEPGRYVKISVTDNGTGMDQATLKRVFEPFFSTRERGRGTGLGLASAYGIIKNHDGFITVYSEKGKGATFNIFLPASSKAAATETIFDQEIIEGKGAVLLIDDEQMVLTVAEEMIRALGYEVTVASDGQKGMNIYRENHDRIDMVILDLIMPGMGGAEAFDHLKAINPDVKVLLSSGYSINGQASAIMKRGCSGFIQKPFSIQELSRKISEVMKTC
ncbi:MAG: PAS domain S-box protein [Desulfosalsimonadaceae bacterium]